VIALEDIDNNTCIRQAQLEDSTTGPILKPKESGTRPGIEFSMPNQLHSNMGAQFESQVIQEVAELLGIRKIHTTLYHSQCDGLVERLNRTIIGMLATMVDHHGDEWENHLAKVCFVYNTSVHVSTGFTPFYLMYGRQARLLVDIIYRTPSMEQSNQSKRLRLSLEGTYALAREKLQSAAQRQKSLHDKRMHGDPFQEGDLMWLCSPAIRKGKSRKLHCPWKGPFEVIKQISDVVYRIQDIQNKQKRVMVHFDRLKPCDPGTRVLQKKKKSRTHKPSSQGTTTSWNSSSSVR